MSTTKQEQYERLRKLFNPSIRGKNIDALLWALANPAAYLVDTVEAIHDNVYIATAVDKYLDQRLADYNVVRPTEVGLSDDIFRQIGISVVNKKQIRDLMMSILTTMFGEELTQATARSGNAEPFNLDDGDKLILKFDGQSPVEIIFNSLQFANIDTASAQEVSDAITKSLRAQGKTGRAFAKDGHVVVISDTSGPQSSVVVLGGRSQNEFLFENIRPTTGGIDTQWTVELVPSGAIRFTWTGGTNPSVGKVRVNDYVNVFGSGFSDENKGTFTITAVKGGVVGSAYFEIENLTGVQEPAPVLQGTLDAVLFFQPFKNTLTTKNRYAAVFQEESNLLEVFIPATTKVVRRERKGAAHIHEPEITTETYDPGLNEIVDATLPTPSTISDGQYFLINSPSSSYYVYFDTTGGNLTDPAPGGAIGIRVDISSCVSANDAAIQLYAVLSSISVFEIANNDGISGGTFSIGPYSLVAGVDFAIGATAALTAQNLAIAASTLPLIEASADLNNVIITTQDPYLDTSISYNNGLDILSATISKPFMIRSPLASLVRICNQDVGSVVDATNVDVSGLIISTVQQGVNSTSTSTTVLNPNESLPDQQGPYSYDLSQPFVLSEVGSQSTMQVTADSGKIIQVLDASQFPDEPGYLEISYGTDRQESMVPYLGRPSSTALLLSPAYQIKNVHPIGTEVRFIAQAGAASISKNGVDYPAYLTDVVSGRTYAEDLINQVAATGINIVITILYPGDEGIGKWGEISSEKVAIWGEDSYV